MFEVNNRNARTTSNSILLRNFRRLIINLDSADETISYYHRIFSQKYYVKRILHVFLGVVLSECHFFLIDTTQLAITCSKLTIETLEQVCEICSKLTIKTPKRRHVQS